MFDSRFGQLPPPFGPLPWRDRSGVAARGRGSEPATGADGSGEQIALIDPHRLWAPGLRRLMADRAALPQRSGAPPRLCHADADEGGDGHTGLAIAARCPMTAVIVGPLAPAAADELLARLCDAARQPHWRCPHLLLLLPHGAVWLANKVDAMRWPAGLRVHCSDAVLNSATAAWDELLAHWNAWLAAPAPAAAELRSPRAALADLMRVDGLLACAVVDAASGAVMARDARETLSIDLDLAAAASAEALRAHRLAARALGQADDAVDDVTVGTGAHLLLLRSAAGRPGLFVLALLDRQRADLLQARARLAEAQAGAGR